YDAPALRPREDTDLLIRFEDCDIVRQVMRGLGHAAPAYCDDVHYQFPFELRDEFGVDHAFDFHWRLSAQAVFADLLTFEELAAEAVPVPALGPDARAAGDVHALLLACVHPVMHHQNEERLIWVHDVHLLLKRLTAEDLDRFTDLAIAKGVAAICAHELSRAHQRFGAAVPEDVMARLNERAGEPTAAYLRPGRTWKDELISNVGALGWKDRLRLLRRVAFPDPAYVLRSHGLRAGTVDAALLPALYVFRGLRGLWKVATGRK
ncbi:MAG: nucleotidyltransferase family protein, partial [Gemmatimonadales bacterium]